MILFSYGTLQNKNIQEREFGQTFKKLGSDSVVGFGLKSIKIESEFYPIATYKKSSNIPGSILEIPDILVYKVDMYEGHGYKRIMVKTSGGISCYMYVEN